MSTSPRKATHQQTKTYNSQLVLKTIYDRGQVSRAEVARLTHLTRATVSGLVNDLIENGLVEEVGRGPSTGGKSPILLSVVPEAYSIAALDLANDEFHGALVNLRGEIIDQNCQPWQNRSGEEALNQVYELIDELVAASQTPLLGIGIGTPGLIDTDQGVVLQAVNLDWSNLALGPILEERYDLPVYIANDSQVTALAQYLFSGEAQTRNLIAIKLGYGIGAGIVLNGQLYQGDGFGAGEIGHVTVQAQGLPCRCGNRGCLETVATERSLVRRAREELEANPSSSLNMAGQKLSAEDLYTAYQAGDELAKQIVLESGATLGMAVANLVGALNIENIWLVGKITRYGDGWLKAIQESAKDASLRALSVNTHVRISPLGEEAVILGASALLMMRELGLDLAR